MTGAGLSRKYLCSVAAMLSGFVTLNADAALVGPGDLAFVRFNAAVPFDDFAIVLLADAPAGQQVNFSTNFYSASLNKFSGAGTQFVWTSDSALAAGTVVTFSDLSRGSPAVSSHGTISGAPTQTMPIDAAGDCIYAYLGTDLLIPEAFLAGISTAGIAPLSEAGLVNGDTAVLLPNGADEAHYVGSRNSESSFPDYRSLIGNVNANWHVRVSGPGSLPAWDTSDFEVAGASTPESPRVVFLCLSCVLLLLARMRTNVASVTG